jgi:hypothetical protein
MDMTKVKLICGEDIYYWNHEFKLLDIFREKQDNKYEALITMAETNFLRIPHKDDTIFKFGEEEKIYHKYQLH